MSDHQTATASLQLRDIEERVHNLVGTLDHYIGEMRAAQAAAQSTYFSFFFMEGEFAYDTWRNFQQHTDYKDTIEHRSGQFYFLDSNPQVNTMPIMSCKVNGSYGDNWKVTFQMLNPETDVITDKTGVMTAHQFKKLCIFVISKSNDTSFLGDFIANGIKPSPYSTYR